MNLPEDFKQEIKSLDIDHDEFLCSLDLSSHTSIRRHKHKSDPDNYKHLEQVDWCTLGYYLEERPRFDIEPSFLTGEYYVQEASSMFLSHALDQLTLFDNEQQPLVLDACAAPGGKSTILLDFLNGRGTLVANEVIRSRVKVLSENIIKWGYSNSIVTNSDISKFSKDVPFDLLVVDAPCSGEGLFRKDPKSIDHWSLEHVQHCAARQKRILADASQLIKPGGYLVYSTCTYNKKENEDQIKWLMSEYNFSVVPIDCPDDWNIHSSSEGYRFLPHLTKGEGLFMSILKKHKEVVPSPVQASHQQSAGINKKEMIALSSWMETSEAEHFQLFQNNIIHYTGKIHFELFKKQRIYSFGRPMGEINKG